MSGSLDLLSIRTGTITAPAGCGKTHLIGESLRKHECPKPVLVLTHTNAGVAALRRRLIKQGVPTTAYRLATIDGWVMRIVRIFPALSNVNPKHLILNKPATDYPALRNAARTVLQTQCMPSLLASTYCRLIVDEYQDCSKQQHAVVTTISQWLPTCVLGDPLQAIFGFGGNPLVNWEEDVLVAFPDAGELKIPWRWNNAGAPELGEWLLSVRETLLGGGQIDLREAPRHVAWVKLDGVGDDELRLAAASTAPPQAGGSVLIIAESKDKAAQYQVASRTPGATSVETADLKDLVAFSMAFDLNDSKALARLCKLAMQTLTGTGVDDAVSRIRDLVLGTTTGPGNALEKAALAFRSNPTYEGAAGVLRLFGRIANVRPHRPEVFSGAIAALMMCASSPGVLLADAAVTIREEMRLRGRPMTARAVGSTLLLKGLESDLAVVLDGDALTRTDLYVALTRGSKGVVVCSRSAYLPEVGGN